MVKLLTKDKGILTLFFLSYRVNRHLNTRRLCSVVGAPSYHVNDPLLDLFVLFATPKPLLRAVRTDDKGSEPNKETTLPSFLPTVK